VSSKRTTISPSSTNTNILAAGKKCSDATVREAILGRKMAESSNPENVISGESMVGGGEQGERALRLHEDVSEINKQDELEHGYVERSSKYDSAHSREVLKMLGSSVQPPTRQPSKKEWQTRNNTEQEPHHGEGSPSIIPPTNGKPDNGSMSGSDAGEEYKDASEQPRCKTRRESRHSGSMPNSLKEEPGLGIRCHCPFNFHRVSHLYKAAALNDPTVEAPNDVQDHFDSCVWRGCIDHALSVRSRVQESATSPSLAEDDYILSKEETPPPPNDETPQHNTDPDPEIALPVSEKETPPKRRRRYTRILSWAIVWIIFLAVFCTVIGQYHTPARAPSLSGEQTKNSTATQDQRVRKWRSFSDVHLYTYTLEWPTKEQIEYFSSNETVRKRSAYPLAARLNNHIDNTWHQDLEAKTILHTTELAVDIAVTTNHTLDLTSVCSPVQTLPTPASPPLRISYRQKEDSKAIVFVKNLLTCLWFLPIWLLSQKLVRKSRLGWLSDDETRVRVRIAAVVVSFLVAAALALGTEVAVREIAGDRRGG
jgi:hypothetical protein